MLASELMNPPMKHTCCCQESANARAVREQRVRKLSTRAHKEHAHCSVLCHGHDWLLAPRLRASPGNSRRRTWQVFQYNPTTDELFYHMLHHESGQSLHLHSACMRSLSNKAPRKALWTADARAPRKTPSGKVVRSYLLRAMSGPSVADRPAPVKKEPLCAESVCESFPPPGTV